MRILIGTHQYYAYWGSETFTFTLACALRASGNEVTLYSPYCGGEIVRQTRRFGIAVVDTLDGVKEHPCDVLQVSHSLVALELRAILPSTPMTFLSHGVLPWLEQPPEEDLNIYRYLAVSEEVRENLLQRAVPPEKIAVFRNLIDTERFAPHSRINDSPRKVLISSGRMDPLTRRTIEAACERMGLQLSSIGQDGVRQVYPERSMNRADICISLGRGILESMACGRAAFVLDYNGGDGFVTSENIDEVQKCNFSGRRYQIRYDVDGLCREFSKYRAEMGETNRRLIEERFSVRTQLKDWLQLYRTALTDRPGPPLATRRIDFHREALRITREQASLKRQLDINTRLIEALYGGEVDPSSKDPTTKDSVDLALDLAARTMSLQKDLEAHRRELEIKDQHIAKLEKIMEAKAEQDLVLNTLIGKLLLGCGRMLGRVFPQGSRARRALSKVVAWGALLFKFNPVNAVSYIKDNGLRAFLIKGLIGKRRGDLPQARYLSRAKRYQLWMDRFEPGADVLHAQRETRFTYAPTLSVISFAAGVSPTDLQGMLDSLRQQTYPGWEFCWVTAADQDERLNAAMEEAIRTDPRVRKVRAQGTKAGENPWNSALAAVRGDWITTLAPHEVLAPFALYEVVQALNRDPATELIYSDEDHLAGPQGKRVDPFFKPDFSPEYLRAYNYIGNTWFVKRDRIESLGGFRPTYAGAQVYDLLLRLTEHTSAIVHIPKILKHTKRRAAAGKGSAVDADTACARQAVADHLARRGANATVGPGDYPGSHRITYPVAPRTLVSIIVPNRDHLQDLKRCIRGLQDRTTHRDFELIIVENGSRDPRVLAYYHRLQETHSNIKLLRYDGEEFNYSKVNNLAVAQAQGELLLFLNNDTEPIGPNWLGDLAGLVQREEVGAAGAKLLFPNGSVQHAGVIVGALPGHQGFAGHAHAFAAPGSDGYFGRLKTSQNCSAVTAACLMIKKRTFAAIGGFDEGYALAFGDVDLCLKLRQRGLEVVWTPHAVLYHHESSTRGPDTQDAQKQQRSRTEMDRLYQNWREVLEQGDPYYNTNLQLHSCDFTPRIA